MNSYDSCLGTGELLDKNSIQTENFQSQETKFTWMDFATKATELMEPLLFFGGIIFTVLIACEILPFGALGIGICIALSFIGQVILFLQMVGR